MKKINIIKDFFNNINIDIEDILIWEKKEKIL
jgi:hypothetical protein